MKKFLLRNMLVLVAMMTGWTGAYAEDDAAQDETIDCVEAADIAALKALKTDEYGTIANVKLKLTKAQVTVFSQSIQTVIIVEDATGGIQISAGGGMRQDPLVEIFDQVGRTVDGFIYCSYEDGYGTKTIASNDYTEKSVYEVSMSEVVPKEVTIDDCNETNFFKCLKLTDVEIGIDPNMGPYLKKGDKQILLADQGFLFGANEDGYVYPKKLNSVTGYIFDMNFGGDEPMYAFSPTDAFPVVENISELSYYTHTGMEVQLKLTDTKVTMLGGSMYYSYIEDATGALKTSSDFWSIGDVFIQGNALNGYIYGTITKDEKTGLIEIGVSEKTGESHVTSEATTITATPTTIKDINEDPVAGVYKYVNLKNVDFKIVPGEDEYSWPTYCLIDGENEIVFADEFWVFDPDMLLPEIVKFNSINGFVAYDKGEENWVFQPYGDDYDYELKPATPVANIAALKKLSDGESAALTLKDAKVTVVEPSPYGWGGDNEVVIEDESGAIMINSSLINAVNGVEEDDWMPWSVTETADEEETETVDYFGKVGSILKGTLYCSYDSMSGAVSSARSSESEITVTEEGTVVPTAIKIADIDAEKDEYRLFTISDATMTMGADGRLAVLSQGENTIKVDDRYNKIEDLLKKLEGGSDEEEPGISPQSDDAEAGDDNVEAEPVVLYIKSATGILVREQGDDYDEATETYAYVNTFIPVGENPFVEGNAPTGIKSISSSVMNSGDVYSVNGVKVRKAGESLNGLAKGLYIVNGKKVVIK